mgnify:CR=1 FL=1
MKISSQKALIDMYSKSVMIAKAQGLFHTFSNRIVYINFFKLKDEELFLQKKQRKRSRMEKAFHKLNVVLIIIKTYSEFFSRSCILRVWSRNIGFTNGKS